MASLDRVKVLVLGDSGERLITTLGLPTLLSYPKILPFHSPSIHPPTDSGSWLNSFLSLKDYTSQRTLLNLTERQRRPGGGRETGAFPLLSQVSTSVSRVTQAQRVFVLKDVQILSVELSARLRQARTLPLGDFN